MTNHGTVGGQFTEKRGEDTCFDSDGGLRGEKCVSGKSLQVRSSIPHATIPVRHIKSLYAASIIPVPIVDFDISYFHVLYNYGWIVFALWIVAYCAGIWYCNRKKN
mgnify:CR=1 FL=1